MNKLEASASASSTPTKNAPAVVTRSSAIDPILDLNLETRSTVQPQIDIAEDPSPMATTALPANLETLTGEVIR